MQHIKEKPQLHNERNTTTYTIHHTPRKPRKKSNCSQLSDSDIVCMVATVQNSLYALQSNANTTIRICKSEFQFRSSLSLAFTLVGHYAGGNHLYKLMIINVKQETVAIMTIIWRPEETAFLIDTYS